MGRIWPLAVKTSPSATGALRKLVPFVVPTDDTSRPATMFRVEAARDRVVASILGLAPGDALGAPFEFRRAHDVPDPLPAFELAWMGLSPGATTDDTAMARNLWTSLVDTRGELDTGDVLRRHLAWFATSPPDVGNLTRRVLSGWRDGRPDSAGAYIERRGPEVSAGNGSVMYCAPLGLAYATRPADLHQAAPALSAITHADERCGSQAREEGSSPAYEVWSRSAGTPTRTPRSQVRCSEPCTAPRRCHRGGSAASRSVP